MGRGTRGWEPPHCPNDKCVYHKALREEWPYKRKGFYTRTNAPHRIQRFTCLACKRHFSSQSFSVDYWLKRPELLGRIFMMVVGCMGNRQIARALGCSPSTVAVQIIHLSRHCLLFHLLELEGLEVQGDIVVDGFETFERSQYFPMHHNVAVGSVYPSGGRRTIVARSTRSRSRSTAGTR